MLQIPYGSGSLPLEEGNAAVLRSAIGELKAAGSGQDIVRAALAAPIGSPRLRELARRFGGKLACTRPVFDRGLLPFRLVIGQSGTVVKPKLLFSFGVSGAVNHVTGITDSEKIVAVNKDPEAAIFHYSDYGIVGDMDEYCEALLKQLEGKE